MNLYVFILNGAVNLTCMTSSLRFIQVVWFHSVRQMRVISCRHRFFETVALLLRLLCGYWANTEITMLKLPLQEDVFCVSTRTVYCGELPARIGMPAKGGGGGRSL